MTEQRVLRLCCERQLPATRAAIAVIVVVVLTASLGLAQDTGVAGTPYRPESTVPEPRLVWTELRILDRRARIHSLPADPTEYINSSRIVTKYYYELSPAHWIAIASDFDDGVAFWSDGSHKKIMKGGLAEGATASGIFDGTSSTVDGIAVDWMANNVYWTDAAYNWIVVADYNMTWMKILVDDGLNKPRGIAVYPQFGYLFWSDWGDSQTIERCTLSGKDRIVLVNEGLYFPNGLTIDYTTDLLYWTDADPSGSRLEASNLDGTNQRVVYTHAQDQGHFFDVAIFQNYIFISDWYSGIRCINKETKEHSFVLTLNGRPFGITTYGPGLLPGNSSPCDVKPCDQLCISINETAFECLCMDGFALLEDGVTCQRNETSLTKPQIILVTQNNICYFPGNFPDAKFTSDYKRNCILTNRTHVVALDVDVAGRTMYFSDFVHKTIQSVRLADGAQVEDLIGGVGSVEGIAADWVTNNVYWTDFQLNHLSVARSDGSNRHILLQDNIIKPRSIVIHAGLRIFFWTEHGPPGQIERASLDGSDRIVILEGPTGLNGLAVDFTADRLYYAESGSIQHVDFDGNGKILLYMRSGALPFDLDIHKDYLLWTEWAKFNGLHAINRENRRPVQSFSINNESVYGVRVYSDDRQPNYENMCIDNGGCQQLCLPVSTGGVRCECSIGYQLSSDGHTCITDVVYDNFLLVSDTYLHSIFQIHLDNSSFSYSSLPLDSRTLRNPVAIAYDPVLAQVYWSDIIRKTIERAYIMNGTQETLFTNEHVEAPDGLALDAYSRLLFWTDMGLPSIQVSHLDGTYRRSLILTEIEKPRAILADPRNGLLYWSDWGETPKIEQVFMDGTNRSILVNTSLGWPNGLDLDYRGNKLYWCDATTDLIEVLDLNTSTRTVLLDLGPVAHPFSIALFEEYIYWTDWTQNALMRADKTTGANNATVGQADFSRLNGLYSYSTSDHAPFSSQCVGELLNGGCSSLCLPTPLGRVCACTDGSSLASDGVTCIGAVQCPAALDHGHVDPECGRSPGSSCNVECDAGYQLHSSRISCGYGGFWDIETDSVCTKVKCQPPPRAQNTNVVDCPQPYFHGSVCVIRCQMGYTRLQGGEQLVCMEDGQWSTSPPTCEVVTCGPLPALSIGVYLPSNCSTAPSTFKSVCRVLCPQSYILRGVASWTCTGNGQWSDINSRSACIDTMPPSFGDSCPNNINITAAYDQITVNITWPEPEATDNSGKVPSVTTNVQQPLDIGQGRHIVTYYARDSNGNTEVCSFVIHVTVLACSVLGPPVNGYLEHCTSHYGSTCSVKCLNGYVTHGSVFRVCQKNDNGELYWTGEPATCQLIECSESATTLNILKGECTPPYYFRAECSYTCAPGYQRRRGSQRRSCQATGMWSGTELECQKIQCPHLAVQEHISVSPVACRTMQNFYNDVCTLTCDDGYQLIGVQNHTCQANGQWSDSDDAHFCQDIEAPDFNGTCPQDMVAMAPHGSTSATIEWTVPVVMDNEGHQLEVTYTKEPTVTLSEGNHTIMIQATDQAGNQETCSFVVSVIVRRCPPFSYPEFSNWGSCNDYLGESCTVTCSFGYLLIGSGSQMCEWSGQEDESPMWKGEPPTCEVVTCPMLDYPEKLISVDCSTRDGRMEFGSVCVVICNVRLSISIQICQEDGSWMALDSDFECGEPLCTALEPLEFGTIVPDVCLEPDIPFGMTCAFFCDPGFILRGQASLDCVNMLPWSTSDLPLCQDMTPPVFEAPCPRIVMNVTLGPCTEGQHVHYATPTATDNSHSVNITGLDEGINSTWLTAGVHERSFTAQDPSGNTAQCLLIIIVKELTQCPPLPMPNHGFITSKTCGDQSGSDVQFGCDDEYQLIGAKRLTCTENGNWSADIPSCSNVFCSPLVLLEWVQFSPATTKYCNVTAVRYNTRCTLKCKAGFVLISDRESTTCLLSGQWSNDVSSAACIDVTPPEFWPSCPAPQTYTLPLGEATMQVEVPVVTATDNSGYKPVITPERSASLMQLVPGDYFFSFKATDRIGNFAHCFTEIRVRDTQPPTVVHCPHATTLSTASLPVRLQWREPFFDDNVGVRAVRIRGDGAVGKPVYAWGLFEVTYTADDFSGNQNTCRVVIDIVEDSALCPPLQTPPNSVLVCQNSHYCLVHCNSGFTLLDTQLPVEPFVCQPNSRRWYRASSSEISYPPVCTKRDSSFRVRWERQDKYVFTFDGTSDVCQTQKEQILANFEALFMKSNFKYCQTDPGNNCMKNIAVSCGYIDNTVHQRGGDTPGRKRRDTNDSWRRLQDDSWRQRRDTVDLSREPEYASPPQANDPSDFHETMNISTTMVIETINISTTIMIERNDTVNTSQAFRVLNTSTSDMWELQNVTFELDGGSFSIVENASKTGKVHVICGDGMVASGLMCVNCPKGTRFKLMIAQCVSCSIATYQNEDGQSSCKMCPPGTTTTAIGAYQLAHCQEMCPAGQLSYWGVTPCQDCPIGSYQTSIGQHRCEPCPDGMTTKGLGASTISQCSGSIPTDAYITMTTIPTLINQSTASSPTNNIGTTPSSNRPSHLTTSAVTNRLPSSSNSSVNSWPFISLGVLLGLVITLVIIGAVCFIVHRKKSSSRNVPSQRGRALSWAGSTTGMIANYEEEAVRDEFGYDRVAITNPVFGMMENDLDSTSPLGATTFSSFLEASEPPVFEDTAAIPRLAPPPKQTRRE